MPVLSGQRTPTQYKEMNMRSRQVFLGFWAALLLWVGWVAPAAAQRGNDAGVYEVVRADYGTYERSVDVTPRVRDLVRWDRPFLVSNDTFDVDPHPRREKTLRIQARGPGGVMQTFEFPEGSSVSGAMFAGHSGGAGVISGTYGPYPYPQGGGDDGQWQILQASYGTAARNVDVTPRLRQLARQDRVFRLTNETFGIDPDRGHPKTLRIYARGRDGQQRMFEYGEGSVVDGARFTGWGGGNWGQGGWRGGWDGGAGPAYPPRGGYLQILQASYGVGDRMIDVTPQLRARQRGDRLEARVDNELAGFDPAPGVPKTLWITYSLGGREQRMRVREADFLRLP